MLLARRTDHCGLCALALLGFLAFVQVRGSARAQVFEDVSAARGTSSAAWIGRGDIAGGVSLVDLDGDQRLDLILTVNHVPQVFQQLASGSFVPRAGALASVTGRAFGGHLPVDIDGDGDLDVLLLANGEDALFRNDGAFVFTDVSRTHLPGLHHWSAAAAQGDFDGDGDVDIYVGGYIETSGFPGHTCSPNALLVNDGQGHFTDEAAEVGVQGFGCALAVLSADYDGDGDLDILVANDFGMFIEPNELFRNEGPAGAASLRFTAVGVEAGFARRLYGMGLAVGDVNHDGHLDVVSTSIGRAALLFGDGSGGFVDRTGSLGLDVTFASEGYQVGWGIAVEDFDGDSWPDVLYAGGNVPASIFARNGQAQRNGVFEGSAAGFRADADDWGFSSTGVGRGLSVGDIDADGRPDVALAHDDGSVALHRNRSGAWTPLRIRLRATETAASAEGSRLVATCAGISRTLWLSGGGSFAGGSDTELRVTFPAPCSQPGQPVEILVHWPSGYTQRAAATTGGAVRVDEPDWLTLAPDRAEVHPTDPSGLPLSAAGAVVLRVGGGAEIPASPLPGGGFEASWSAPSNPARLDLIVSGSLWGVHPEIAAPRVRLRTVPQRVVVGEPVQLIVTAAGTGVLSTDKSVVVMVGTDPVILSPVEDGWFSAPVSFAGVGVTALRVQVDGVEVAYADIEVGPAVDARRSFVRFDTLYQLAMPFFQARGVFRDRNGRELNIDPSRVRVSANGVPLGAVIASSSLGAFELAYNTSQVADGSAVELSVDGSRVGELQVLRRLSAADQVLAYVSPAHSRCAPAMETMRADGEDLLDVIMFLRDSFGQPLPDFGTLPRIVGDLTMLPDSPVSFSSYHVAQVRAGTTPGLATMEVEWFGQRTGVSCTVELAPRRALDAASASLSAVPPTLDVLQPGATSMITWAPRSASGRLLGSGVGPSWSATLGAWDGEWAYEGLGRYVRRLGPGEYGGEALVRVDGAGVVSSTHITVLGPGLDAGVGGRGDAGGSFDADAARGDAAFVDDGSIPRDERGVPPEMDAGSVGDTGGHGIAVRGGACSAGGLASHGGDAVMWFALASMVGARRIPRRKNKSGLW